MGDTLGYHTYYGTRGSSTTDYFIASEDLFHVFSFVNTLPSSELFDHSVIWTGLNIKYLSFYTNESVDTNCHALSGKYLIDDASKQKYLASLNDDESRNLLHSFITNVDDQDSSIDMLTNRLSNIIRKAAFKSIKFKRFFHARKKNIRF